MLLFSEYNILVQPPLKLQNTIGACDEADNVKEFLSRKVHNLRKLLAHSHFKDQFKL